MSRQDDLTQLSSEFSFLPLQSLRGMPRARFNLVRFAGFMRRLRDLCTQLI